jgi:hypothetical protein
MVPEQTLEIQVIQIAEQQETVVRQVRRVPQE